LVDFNYFNDYSKERDINLLKSKQ